MKVGHFLDWLFDRNQNELCAVLFVAVVVGVIITYAFGRRDPDAPA